MHAEDISKLPHPVNPIRQNDFTLADFFRIRLRMLQSVCYPGGYLWLFGVVWAEIAISGE